VLSTSSIHQTSTHFSHPHIHKMSSPNPTFIFVPGAFSPAHYFHKVLSLLHKRGYTTSLALDLPSMDASLHADGQTPGLYADATFVRDTAASFMASGQDVILVGNSYGGAVSQEASKGLVGQGNVHGKGELKHIILINSLMADAGFTIADLVGGNLPLDTSTKYIPPIDPAVAGHVLFPSLPKAEQDEYAVMGKQMSALAFLEPLTFAAWKKVNFTVVIGANDVPAPMERQVEFYDKAVGIGAKGAKKVVIEGGDHLTMLSHPEEVVKVCLEAAGVEA
jgi:pimeloyl-ACP methyl ester carboxylesterase